MLIDIENEYNDHICNQWNEFSDIIEDIFYYSQNQENTSKVISQQSMDFLKEKLEDLEAKNE